MTVNVKVDETIFVLDFMPKTKVFFHDGTFYKKIGDPSGDVREIEAKPHEKQGARYIYSGGSLLKLSKDLKIQIGDTLILDAQELKVIKMHPSYRENGDPDQVIIWTETPYYPLPNIVYQAIQQALERNPECRIAAVHPNSIDFVEEIPFCNPIEQRRKASQSEKSKTVSSKSSQLKDGTSDTCPAVPET